MFFPTINLLCIIFPVLAQERYLILVRTNVREVWAVPRYERGKRTACWRGEPSPPALNVPGAQGTACFHTFLLVGERVGSSDSHPTLQGEKRGWGQGHGLVFLRLISSISEPLIKY